MHFKPIPLLLRALLLSVLVMGFQNCGSGFALKDSLGTALQTSSASGTGTSVGGTGGGGGTSVSPSTGTPIILPDSTSCGSGSVTSQLGVVRQAYCIGFGRAADDAGAQYFSDSISRLEVSSRGLIWQLLSSPEGQMQIAGLSNAQFVQFLYTRLLGRTADASGLSTWVGQLERKVPRRSLVRRFIYSTEFMAGQEAFFKGLNGTSVCSALSAYNGTGQDAKATVQNCIANAAEGSTLELPVGTYHLKSAILVNKPLHLKTQGRTLSSARCSNTVNDCAQFVADTEFTGDGGILQSTAGNTIIDHIVVDGNNNARQNSTSAQICASGNNYHGYNIRGAANNFLIIGSISRGALCGTALYIGGKNAEVVNNLVTQNGLRSTSRWADGITVNDAHGSYFSDNLVSDNTDVDFIFGGCRDCDIQGNSVVHSNNEQLSSFAALMIHSWPNGSTSGDYTGADISFNTIDCSAGKKCGVGLLLGADPWYAATLTGGSYHHNIITNTQQGLDIATATGTISVFDNPVTNSGGTFKTACGYRDMTHFNMTPGSQVDRSQDTIGTQYNTQSWSNGCVPNWL